MKLSLEMRESNKQEDVTMSVPAFGTPVLLCPSSMKGQEETGITIPLIKVTALKVNDTWSRRQTKAALTFIAKAAACNRYRSLSQID